MQEKTTTQTQAKQLLKAGKIMKHASFIEGEYLREVNGVLLDEDSNQLDAQEFWRLRSAEIWQTGWSVEDRQCKACTHFGNLVFKKDGFCSIECADNYGYKPDMQHIIDGSHGSGMYDVNTGKYFGNE